MIKNGITPLAITRNLETNSVFHRRNICIICFGEKKKKKMFEAVHQNNKLWSLTTWRDFRILEFGPCRAHFMVNESSTSE